MTLSRIERLLVRSTVMIVMIMELVKLAIFEFSR
jgi:hypothetical protein